MQLKARSSWSCEQRHYQTPNSEDYQDQHLHRLQMTNRRYQDDAIIPEEDEGRPDEMFPLVGA
jgi:hypothetical protein